MEHGLCARLVPHPPGICCWSLGAGIPPVTRSTGDNSQGGLLTAQGCLEPVGNRRMRRGGVVVWRDRGFDFAFFHLLLKETGQ
jgi:hypothetical protein